MARTYKFCFTKKNAMDTEDSVRGLVLSTVVSFAMILTTVAILVGGCTGASDNTVVRDIAATNCDNSITINRARKTVEENRTHSWSRMVRPCRLPVMAPQRRIEKLLNNHVRYLLSVMPPREIANEQEIPIRERTGIAFSCAVCLRFTDCEAPDKVRAAAIELLTRLTETHMTGTEVTETDKPWGDRWQSAMWTWQAVFAGWLIWDELEPELRDAVIAMGIFEADRFDEIDPPYAEYGDTKAEENAWNSLILILMSEILPDHYNSSKWRHRGIEYMISAMATREDRTSDVVIDGRALRERVKGANVHSDFTLENHGIVHPDYMCTIGLNMANALVYRLLGQPIPHNVKALYENLKFFTMPDGAFFYPNATDWNLHRLDTTWPIHVQVERLMHDTQAAALADVALDTLERMQKRNPDGRIFAPGEFVLYPKPEPHVGVQIAKALMFTKLWPPVDRAEPIDKVWEKLLGPRIFEDGRFAMIRTKSSISSFAWGPVMIGQTVPFALDPIINPYPHSLIGIATGLPADIPKPSRRGIGSVSLEETIAKDPLECYSLRYKIESGALHVTGKLKRGQATQDFSFTALPSGKSVYMERFQGETSSIHGTMISLVEEPTWIYANKSRSVKRGRNWANVNNKLGFALSQTGGFRQIQDIRNKLLFLNDNPKPETTAVTVILPNADVEQTKRLDGFIVVSNFSRGPTTIQVEHNSSVYTIPINGRGTRVVPVN
ncbi:MAG: hypothetical protein ACYS6K_29455 [Planctomycetota bacterium]|jgi:hypothetical protein